MKLGMQVGLVPGHIVLDGDTALSSEDVGLLVITSCTARARHSSSSTPPIPKKSAWALPILCTVEPATLKKQLLFHADFNRDFNHDFLHSGTPF